MSSISYSKINCFSNGLCKTINQLYKGTYYDNNKSIYKYNSSTLCNIAINE